MLIMNLLQLISCILLSYCSLVNSIMFTLQPNTQKCLREEIKKNDLLIGEFQVSDLPGQQVDYVVTDSKREILSRKENIKGAGKFSVIMETHDVIEICFKSKAPTHLRTTPHEVLLVVKRSAEAKQVEGLAEASKLRPMEIELKTLEILADSIVSDFMDMREREKQMRDTNENTNNRVLYLSIFSMFILLGLAVWQVLYLKKFFKAKKLIE